jgi:hypothetical protein
MGIEALWQVLPDCRALSGGGVAIATKTAASMGRHRRADDGQIAERPPQLAASSQLCGRGERSARAGVMWKPAQSPL